MKWHIAALLFGALSQLIPLAVVSDYVRLRVALVIVSAILIGALLSARKNPREIALSSTLLLLQLLLATFAVYFSSRDPVLHPEFQILSSMLSAAVGLSFFVLVRRRTEISEVHVSSLPLTVFLVLSLLAIFSLRVEAGLLKPFTIDSARYFLQGQLLSQGKFGVTIPAELRPFFTQNYLFEGVSGFTTQYPPGWPAVIAILSLVGLKWFAPTLVFCAVVGLVYLSAKRDVGVQSALVIAAVAATNSMLSLQSCSFFAHLCCAMFLLIGGLGLRMKGAAQFWSFTSGIAFGCAANARPITAVAGGLSIALWLFLMNRESLSIRRLIFAASGFVMPIVLLCIYNLKTTGSSYVLGYTKTHGALHAYGLGIRGFVRYSAEGTPVVFKSQFALQNAFGNLIGETSGMLLEVFPSILIVPVLYLFFMQVNRSPRCFLRIVVCFLPLPLCYALYFWRDARFLTEMVPFLLLTFGIGFYKFFNAEIKARYAPLITFILVAGLLKSFIEINRMGNEYQSTFLSDFESVETFRRANGDQVLVFIEYPADDALTFYPALLRYNDENWFGDTIVARDLGERNSILTSAFPNHRVLKISYKNR